tara:strand:+ start:811 stop:1191 length:381 start_codon:yes stop_codon:yes gene_type:complete
MDFPENYLYTKDHEWGHLEGETLTVGITDHAQSSLGDIVYLELPEIGRELSEGETFGVVESVKAVSDLYSPCDGKVIEVNEALVDDPSSLNTDPHLSAWMIKLEVKSGATDKLLKLNEYQQLVDQA